MADILNDLRAWTDGQEPTAKERRAADEIERLTAALLATLPALHSSMADDNPVYARARELLGVKYDPRGLYEQIERE